MSLLEKCILVVDDQQLVRDMIVSILESQGYAVQSAKDGQEAANLFYRCPERIALVITDFDMPRKNGMQLAMELRVAQPMLPIVVMSGTFTQYEEVAGISCISKPFSIKALLGEVEKQLETVNSDGMIPDLVG